MRLIWARYEDGEVGICLQGKSEEKDGYSIIKVSDEQAISLAEDLLKLARECKHSRKFYEKRP
jgi:hypothetical protein